MYATTHDNHFHGEPAPNPIAPDCLKDRGDDRDVEWELVSTAVVPLPLALTDGYRGGFRIYWFWRGC